MLAGCMFMPSLPKEEAPESPQTSAGGQTALPLGKYSIVSFWEDGQEFIDDFPDFGINADDVYFAIKENDEFSLNFTALGEGFEYYLGRGKFEFEGNTLLLYYSDGDLDKLVIDGSQATLYFEEDVFVVFEKTYPPGYSPDEVRDFERRLSELPKRDPYPNAEEFIMLAEICVDLFEYPESLLLMDDNWADNTDPYGYGSTVQAKYIKDLMVFGKLRSVQININDWVVERVSVSDKDTSFAAAAAMIDMVPGVSNFSGRDPISITMNREDVSLSDAEKIVASAIKSDNYREEISFLIQWPSTKFDRGRSYLQAHYNFKPYENSNDSENISYGFRSANWASDIRDTLDDMQSLTDEQDE